MGWSMVTGILTFLAIKYSIGLVLTDEEADQGIDYVEFTRGAYNFLEMHVPKISSMPVIDDNNENEDAAAKPLAAPEPKSEPELPSPPAEDDGKADVEPEKVVEVAAADGGGEA